MRPSAVIEALDFHASTREPVGLLGAPGVGKSQMVAQIAKKHDLPLITMNLVLSDPTDLRGLPFVLTLEDGTKVTEWVKQRQFLTNQPIALFLDELFQSPVATMNAAAPIVLEKRIDDLYLHTDSWVVFASNRMEDKAGTNRVPSHIPNRCTLLDGPHPDTDDWSEWAIDNNVDIGTIQYLRMDRGALHDFDPSRLINATPRQWEWVGRNYAKLPKSIRLDVVAGRVGEGYAAKYIAFQDMQHELPPLEQILLNPKSARVPENMSARYLVAGMLGQAAAPGNFDAVAEYAGRLPEELQAYLVKDAIRRQPGITSTKAFVSWGVKFAEVLR